MQADQRTTTTGEKEHYVDEEDLKAAMKEVMGPHLLDQLGSGKICFYPGPAAGAPPDFEDFLGVMDYLGDCDTLVYSEVRLTKAETRKMLDWHRLNLQIPTQLGCINEILMTERREVERELIFRTAEAEWIGTMPGEDQLWADYARLRITNCGVKPRYVHLLHLGIGGLAAWLWFFQPHGLKVARLVTNRVPR